MSYKIELLPSPLNAARDTYWRGGRKFTIREPQILELTDEELEVYKNDARFKISDSKNTSEEVQSAKTPKSETLPHSDSTATEEVVEDESETVTDSDTPQEETLDNKGEELSFLLKANSREELNALAEEAGIENPAGFNNKEELGKAILEIEN